MKKFLRAAKPNGRAASPTGRSIGFAPLASSPLNNAVLMHYIVYLKDLDLFESLYESCGRDLLRTVEALRQAAKGGEPFEALRSWLAQRQPIVGGAK